MIPEPTPPPEPTNLPRGFRSRTWVDRHGTWIQAEPAYRWRGHSVRDHRMYPHLLRRLIEWACKEGYTLGEITHYDGDWEPKWDGGYFWSASEIVIPLHPVDGAE